MEQPRKPHLIAAGAKLRRWREEHKARFKTNRALAEACERTESWLSLVFAGSIECMPRQAMLLHKITGGAVSGDMLRPDLWRCAADVPIERLRKAA